ncbi:hypothetical protein AAFC00_001476 [Neodothiora populina]|uniref:Apple domain-containing protein n=1 Tax=Neodothiora populina TaxID=2781224 RepID=A0ABR3PP27_9PEZI
MPSMIVTAAAGLMAFSGLATAIPQGVSYNGTMPAGNGTSGAGSARPSGMPSGGSMSNSTALPESLFCPKLSGSVLTSPSGVEFLLECSTNHFGVIIDVQYNSTAFAKRQATVAPANIQDCLAACDAVPDCTATAFDTAARTCALYSSVGAAYAADGIDFALQISEDEPTTIAPGGTMTSTLYSTAVQTISSCAPTVTDCPLRGAVGAAVVTEVIPVTSTDYICPTSTVIPAGPAACSCAWGASTATVYATSVVGGSTTVVPVSTKVVAVPSPSGTTYSTTVVQGHGPAVTTGPVTAGAYAPGASSTSTGAKPVYSGGASNVKAGMGLLAGVAGVAFML